MRPKNKFVFDNEYKVKTLNFKVNTENITKNDKEFCDEIEMLIDAEENMRSMPVEEKCVIGNEQSTECVGIHPMDRECSYVEEHASTECASVKLGNRQCGDMEDCANIETDKKCSGKNEYNTEKENKQSKDICSTEKNKDLFKSVDIKDFFSNNQFTPKLCNLMENNVIDWKEGKCYAHDTERKSDDNGNLCVNEQYSGKKECHTMEKLIFGLPSAYNTIKIDNIEKNYQLTVLDDKVRCLKKENKVLKDIYIEKIKEMQTVLASSTKNDVLIKQLSDIRTVVDGIASTSLSVKHDDKILDLESRLYEMVNENAQLRSDNARLECMLKDGITLSAIDDKIKEINDNTLSISKRHDEYAQSLAKYIDNRRTLKCYYRSRMEDINRTIILIRESCTDLLKHVSKTKLLVNRIGMFKSSLMNEQLVAQSEQILVMQNDYECKLRLLQDEIRKIKKQKKKIKPNNSDVWNVF